MAARVKRHQALFEYKIHVNPDKGPNRITFEKGKALKYFLKVKNNHKNEDSVVRVTHLPTKLLWESNSYGDFEYFLGTVVQTAEEQAYVI